MQIRRGENCAPFCSLMQILCYAHIRQNKNVEGVKEDRSPGILVT